MDLSLHSFWFCSFWWDHFNSLYFSSWYRSHSLALKSWGFWNKLSYIMICNSCINGKRSLFSILLCKADISRPMRQIIFRCKRACGILIDPLHLGCGCYIFIHTSIICLEVSACCRRKHHLLDNVHLNNGNPIFVLDEQYILYIGTSLRILHNSGLQVCIMIWSHVLTIHSRNAKPFPFVCSDLHKPSHYLHHTMDNLSIFSTFWYEGIMTSTPSF